ncbi:hypothetical protein EBB07_06145 [Paenibacillaceae bacterium]|nr:hypothetical protein EBB07_06145 [Paenibacillaceae bacterium]
MKIMLKNRRFHGGSSLSLLEYGKLLHQHGHEVVSAGEYSKTKGAYDEAGIATHAIPVFRNSRPLGNMRTLYDYCRLLKREKIELIVATAVCNCVYHEVIRKLLGIPVVYIIPGAEIPAYFTRIVRNRDLIVFSRENRQALIDNGYSEPNIHLITNRLSFDQAAHNFEPARTDRTIRLLMISRLDDEKIESVRLVIDYARKLVEDAGHDVSLHLVGDGRWLETIRSEAAHINERLSSPVIQVEGFQADVMKYIRHAHIAFGKARSVLEPMYYNKLAYVVNEAGGMWQVGPDNIAELQRTNFSGRSVACPASAFAELEQTVSNLKRTANSHEVQEVLESNRSFVRAHYDIAHAKHAILDHIQHAKANSRSASASSGLVQGAVEYARIYGQIAGHLISGKVRARS